MRGLFFLLAFSCAATSCSNSEEEADPLAQFEEGENLSGGETTNTLLFGVNAFSSAVSNLYPEHQRGFFAGNGAFTQPWVPGLQSTTARDGLGPFFNAISCEACHDRDGRGDPNPESRTPHALLFRIRIGVNEDGLGQPDPRYGDQLSPFATSDILPEGSIVTLEEEIEIELADGESKTLLKPNYTFTDVNYGEPSADLVLSPRVAPAIYGLGLLQAIPEKRLFELSDEDDLNEDGISGRVRMVEEVETGEMKAGRFGWKNEQPSIRQQNAGAFSGDMGLTTSLFPEPNCSSIQEDCLNEFEAAEGDEEEVQRSTFDSIEFYSSLLAVPARSKKTASDSFVLRGKSLFTTVGCADCHTPKHLTGEAKFGELSDQTIYPYTDLLLHDMGKELADGEGAELFDREWRTPPLWGLRFYSVVNGHERLLHDGRARGVEDAILWHAGEGALSQELYKSLEASDREALIKFVKSL